MGTLTVLICRSAPLPTPPLSSRSNTSNATSHESSSPPSSPLTTFGNYLRATLLRTLPTERRCGGRRKCRGGSSPPPSPPPPPSPTRITQSLFFQRVKTSDYGGIFKQIFEAGWGITIGIYGAAGISITSSASNTCDANRCGMAVEFKAKIPYGLGHRTDSLSASGFCNGMASAKEAVAPSTPSTNSTLPFIRVPNVTDCYRWNVTVLTMKVDEHEDNTWIEVGIALGIAGVCLGGLCCLLGISMSK